MLSGNEGFFCVRVSGARLMEMMIVDREPFTVSHIP